MGADRERADRQGIGSNRGLGRTSNWNFRLSISPSPAKMAKLFGEAAKEFNDFRPAWKRLAPKILRGIKGIIDSRGSAIGEPWPGLRDKYYLDRKARKGWNRAELYATGLLAASIETLSITKRSMRVGTSVHYARALQWGRSGKNKSRIFIGMSPQMTTDAIDELNAETNAIFARLASKLNQKGS